MTVVDSNLLLVWLEQVISFIIIHSKHQLRIVYTFTLPVLFTFPASRLRFCTFSTYHFTYLPHYSNSPTLFHIIQINCTLFHSIQHYSTLFTLFIFHVMQFYSLPSQHIHVLRITCITVTAYILISSYLIIFLSYIHSHIIFSYLYYSSFLIFTFNFQFLIILQFSYLSLYISYFHITL